MTFEAVMDDVSLFRDSLSTVGEFLDETELHVNMDGIRLTASDRAVVVVVNLMLHRDYFLSYNYEQDVRIGVNLQNLLQIVKRAKPDEQVKLALEGNKLSISHTNEKNTVRNFSLPLIDISRDETPPLDKLDFPASVILNSEVLSSGVEDAEIVADSIVVTLRKDYFMLKAENDAKMAQLILQPSDTVKISDVIEPMRSRYSTDYLKKITKAKKLSEEVELRLSNDYPLKVQYTVPGKVQLSFILAPRVEE